MATDVAGDIYVADSLNDRIQKFRYAPSSVEPSTWGRLKIIYR